ncbi:Tubulin polyglutamylase TTLL13-like [Oopsacas minuta]|uniref:Tubulin polyglutamylase TTLL13-like n=1 Tax=Oopsacas minuta TaxID=111878 RepID=A0AAV7KHA9_9METZ|nr:Tubulin polyglutamylase TTLL13-like [Oopsacas minuta]
MTTPDSCQIDNDNKDNISEQVTAKQSAQDVTDGNIAQSLSNDAMQSPVTSNISCAPSCDVLSIDGEETGESEKKKRKKKKLGINLINCKYDSVHRVSRRFGLKEMGDDEDWVIFWTDVSVAMERVMALKRYQKINHFPGMIEICRKDMLARNITRMMRLFPKEYYITPKSWCLPSEWAQLHDYLRGKKGNKYLIFKPEAGCQGKGIFITKNIKEVKPTERYICQEYIQKPILIDNYKFDLRIYVLITSCDPLRVFTYYEGLGRFCTREYQDPTGHNQEEVYMHLTNYAINKHSKDFVVDDMSGSKRRFVSVNSSLREAGYDVEQLWIDIEDVIIKTLISIHPILKHNYRSCFAHHTITSACFEILGFDILIDRKVRPLLLEVNHSPSFHTDAPMDKDIKEGLLYETLNLIDLGSCDKRKCQEEERKRVQERLFTKRPPKDRKEEETVLANYLEHLAIHEKKHMKGFKLIYPNGNEEKYAKYFEQSASLFGETAASRARQECAKNQRLELEAKQKQYDEFKQGPVKKPPAAPKAPKPESPVREKAETKNKPLFTLYDKYKKSVTPSVSSQPQILPEGERDSSRPLSIADDEELERLALMLQRDSLVRSTGIAEQLYSILDGVNSPPTNQRPPPPTHPLPINRPLAMLSNNLQYIPKMLPNIYTLDQEMNRALVTRERTLVDYFPKLNKKRPSNYRVNCDVSQNFAPDNSMDYRSNSSNRRNSFGMWPVKSQSDQNMCARLMKQDFLLTPHVVNTGNPSSYDTQDHLSDMGTGGKGSSSTQLQLVSQSAALSHRPDLNVIGKRHNIPSDNVKMNRTQRIREATNSIKVKQLVLQSQSQSNLLLP